MATPPQTYNDYETLIKANTEENNQIICEALQKLPSVYTIASYNGENLLHAACRYKNPTIAEYLLANKRIQPNLDNYRYKRVARGSKSRVHFSKVRILLGVQYKSAYCFVPACIRAQYNGRKSNLNDR